MNKVTIAPLVILIIIGERIWPYMEELPVNATVFVLLWQQERISCSDDVIMCRVRMQAVNAIGHGAFCLPLKVVTKSLPPQPPCLECVVIGSSSLKLKWRDSRYIDLTQYILEMQRSDGRFV